MLHDSLQVSWAKLLILTVVLTMAGCQAAETSKPNQPSPEHTTSSQATSSKAVASYPAGWEPVASSVYDASSDPVHRPGYCDRFARNLKVLDRLGRFEKIGVDVFHLTLRGENTEFYNTPYWTDLDTYPEHPKYDDPSPATLDVQARYILKTMPDARFSVHFFAAPPLKWAKRFPDQMQTGSDGKVYRAASYASASWLKGQREMIKNLIRDVQSQPWGKQVDGYVIIPHTEGATELSVYGEPFDQSQAMQQAFAKFVKNKYKTDAQLQAAWGDEKITLASAKVPTLGQYKHDRAGWLTWPTPNQTQKYQDYFLLQRTLFKNALDGMAKAAHEAADGKPYVLIDALKQPMAGWMITDAFDAAGKGMSFPQLMLAAGSTDVASILDLPSIDGFMTPADYTARATGWGFEIEGIADSVVLRKKIMFAEDDARSWTKSYSRKTQGAWRNPQEARAGLLRNLSMCASRGLSHYWCNAGDGYFDGDEIMSVVQDLLPQARAALSTPAVPTQHAIAMILDDESAIDSDFTSGFDQLAVIQQRVHELALTGLPYRIYLLSDLKRDDFPKFKAYLFPNLFNLTPEKMAIIRNKVFRDGSIAIFGPGTGAVSGNERSTKEVSEFLGINLKLVPKKAARHVMVEAGSHPALSEVKVPVVYGDSYEYGPILTPDIDPQKDVVELGRASIYWSLNTPGLVLREFGKGCANKTTDSNAAAKKRGAGDYGVVFSTATPMPAAVLRSLALYAGCNPWSALGDVVNASKRMVSVHSIRSGPRTIQLPEPAYVTDLKTGLRSTKPLSKIQVTLNGPDTRLYLLTPAK